MATINGFFMIYTSNMILMIFGGLSSYLAFGDFRIFILTLRNKEISKTRWLLRHIGMMVGAYISTSTAFLVVNITTFNPAWLPWLVPTFLGTPLIFYWTRKYSPKRKLARVKSA